MKRLLFLLLTVATCCLNSNAKMKPAVIETFDGERIECLTSGRASKITYKLSENGPKEKIDAAKVKYLEYLSGDDRINLWLHMPMRIVKRNGSIEKAPLMQKTSWVQLFDDPRHSEKTVMFVLTISSRYGTSYYYGCYRDSDDYAVLCTFGLGYSEENAVSVYMSDCPAIAEYVKQKEIKIRNGADLQKIIDEYNNCK
ncbi:MAG: hypothetical protein J6Z12_01985 [Paludibacteraceae bacterium]|nr:hypothetical protein [Paludibacteraceae bacterium]